MHQKEHNQLDEKYKDMLHHILNNGVKKVDRTGTGTLSVFDYTIKHKMSEGFPLLTSKKMFTKGIIHELIWFLNGETNIKYLVENNIHIWTGDAYKNYCKSHEELIDGYLHVKPIEHSRESFINEIKNNEKFAAKWGELGPIYGKQWRKWNKYTIKPGIVQRVDGKYNENYYDLDYQIDQIKNLINDLKENPDSRRLMVNAWNPGDLDDMVLPPCHYSFQCYTVEMSLEERKEYWTKTLNKSIHYAKEFDIKDLDERNVPKRKLSLKWHQRSVDTCLGLPFNLASYGLLLELLAKETNMIADELIFSGGDCHIYLNHIEGAKQQLRNEIFNLPTLKLNNQSFDFKIDDVEIINYKSSKSINYQLSN